MKGYVRKAMEEYQVDKVVLLAEAIELVIKLVDGEHARLKAAGPRFYP